MVYYKRLEKENIMKNLVLRERKNQKQQEKENFKYIETEVKTQNNLCFLNNYIKAGKNIQSKGENKYVL